MFLGSIWILFATSLVFGPHNEMGTMVAMTVMMMMMMVVVMMMMMMTMMRDNVVFGPSIRKM